jgi:hypothetical protein
MIEVNVFYKIIFVCVWCITFSYSAWANTTSPLTGTYYGTANATIVYDNTDPANPKFNSLGTIDLAVYLDVIGSDIQPATSYIVLDKTLLFPAVPPQIGGKDVGPRVNGSLSPSGFKLTTVNLSLPPAPDGFTSVVSGVTVTRKVTLTGTAITNDGNSITGTYTETINGLTPETITVTGFFLLVKPTVPTVTVTVKDQDGDGWLSLAEIRAGGKDPNVIEFSDLSYALHLYNNPLPSLKVGSTVDPTGQQSIKDAFAEFGASMKLQK